MPSTRRSAKQAATDLANTWIKEHENCEPSRRRAIAARIFGLELLAIHMDWKQLDRRLQTFREADIVDTLNPSDSDCATTRSTTQTKG